MYSKKKSTDPKMFASSGRGETARERRPRRPHLLHLPRLISGTRSRRKGVGEGEIADACTCTRPRARRRSAA